ncbi:uncharacterized protein N7496_012643 [Penicillium cataractarum]|uniref:Uncharacterized protein n=1 Tax=Penicillium cataractarum TaxID=2100454 RepID=A0A9W9R886_9EURO|nr:uncharacterized protein N7496_012643 [Penicillium cataractarum]KAJ5355431.1 hypothetical protein N7496_012643 [Penicillium cataractarum]
MNILVYIQHPDIMTEHRLEYSMVPVNSWTSDLLLQKTPAVNAVAERNGTELPDQRAALALAQG